MQSWATESLTMARIPVAMSDCVRSWGYYIKHLNNGRPFILAGFSQGAHALMEILKRMPDSVASRMVAAYPIGYKVTREDTAACRHLRPALGATDTGVTINFNSVKSPECEIPVVSAGNIFCINPVNWRTDTLSTPFILYGRKKNDTLTVSLDPESRLLLIAGYNNDKPMAVIGKSLCWLPLHDVYNTRREELHLHVLCKARHAHQPGNNSNHTFLHIFRFYFSVVCCSFRSRNAATRSAMF